MRKNWFVILLLFFIFPNSRARADTIDPLDVNGWKVEAVYRIDVRLSDLVVIYLGFETLYSNPNNLGEFALVTKRFRPLIMAKSDPRNDRMFRKAVVDSRDWEELKNILRKRYDEADTIVCQKWREVTDVQTNQPVRKGDLEIWFLDSTGNARVTFNQKVSVAPISELRSSDFKDGILAGVRYSIGDSYQITRAEHVFLVTTLKKEKKS